MLAPNETSHKASVFVPCAQVQTHTVVVEVLREAAASQLRRRLSGGSIGSGADGLPPGSGYDALPSQVTTCPAFKRSQVQPFCHEVTISCARWCWEALCCLPRSNLPSPAFQQQSCGTFVLYNWFSPSQYAEIMVLACLSRWVPTQAVRSQMGLESPVRLAASAPEPRRLPSNPLGSTGPSTPTAVSWPRPQHRPSLPAAGAAYPGAHPGSSPGSTPARSMPGSPAMSAKPPLPRLRSSDMPRGSPPPRRWSDPQVRTMARLRGVIGYEFAYTCLTYDALQTSKVQQVVSSRIHVKH